MCVSEAKSKDWNDDWWEPCDGESESFKTLCSQKGRVEPNKIKQACQHIALCVLSHSDANGHQTLKGPTPTFKEELDGKLRKLKLLESTAKISAACLRIPTFVTACFQHLPVAAYQSDVLPLEGRRLQRQERLRLQF